MAKRILTTGGTQFVAICEESSHEGVFALFNPKLKDILGENRASYAPYWLCGENNYKKVEDYKV